MARHTTGMQSLHAQPGSRNDLGANVKICRVRDPAINVLRATGVGIRTVQENGRGPLEGIVAASNGEDPLDKTGQEILGLLQRAASFAEKNSQHALGIAHKLSLELRAAEDHIKRLEEELQYYKDRSNRAEEWLRQISAQIQTQFPAHPEAPSGKEPARHNGPEAYAPKKQERRRP